MGSAINKLMQDDGPKQMYSQRFQQIIEDHLDHLRNYRGSEIIDIKPKLAYRHEGDLFALLDAYNIPKHHQWIIMRINGYDSPMQYRGETELIVPSQTRIRQLFRIYRSSDKLAKKRSKRR